MRQSVSKMSSGFRHPKNRDIVLLGAGGLSLDVIAIISAINSVQPQWNIIGFMDDDPAKHGAFCGGIPVLGPIDAAVDYPRSQFIMCMSGPESHFVRSDTYERLGLPMERYATLVHPLASIAGGAEIGCGSIVFAGATVTAEMSIGAHVILRPNSVISHDDKIEDYVSVGAGAVLAGHVTLRKNVYVGAGASIRGYITIGEGALIGMGAAVLRDIPPFEVWVGNPARFLRPVRRQGTSTLKAMLKSTC